MTSTLPDTLAGFSAILVDDQTVEIRAFGPNRPFTRVYGPDDREKMLAKVRRLDGRLRAPYHGIYFTLNPLRDDLAGSATDADVTRRTLLLIDADPVRSGTVSATDAEKAAALEVIRKAWDYLRELGWPEPIACDSGNGYHLLYRVDLPAADGDLVKRCLLALAARLDTDAAKVDTVVYNPSRICKVYGTMVRKGEPTDDRPHRRSSVLEIPDGWAEGPVPPELLEALADSLVVDPPAPPPPPSAPRPRAGGDGRWAPEVRAAAYLEKCEPAISGQAGHKKAFKAACKVGPGFDLPPAVARRLLAEVYNPTCVPPWSDRELEHKVAEAYKVETRRGWLLDQERDRPRVNGRAHGNGTAAPPPTDPPTAEATGEPPPKPEYATLADAMILIGATRWFWDQWIPLGTMSLLAAPAGEGKTRTAMDLARRLWFGLPMPDGSPNPYPPGTRTLWVLVDRNWQETAEVARSYGVPWGAIQLHSPKDAPLSTPDLDDPAVLAALQQQVIDQTPGLVVIDTITYATSRNTARAEEAKAAFDMILMLAANTGVAVLALTHLNKEGEVLNRRITERARAVLKLTCPDPDGQPNRRRFWVDKTAVKKPPALGLTMADSGNEYDDAPPEAKPKEAKPTGPPPARSTGRAEWLWSFLGKGPFTVTGIVDAARDAGLLKAPTEKDPKPSISPLYAAKEAIPRIHPGWRIEQFEADVDGRSRKHWRLASDDEYEPESPDF